MEWREPYPGQLSEGRKVLDLVFSYNEISSNNHNNIRFTENNGELKGKWENIKTELIPLYNETSYFVKKL